MYSKCIVKVAISAALLAVAPALVSAHDDGSAGEPVCLEANFMMADAMNTPSASAFGPGRVLEMNIFTGERGITVNNPFGPGNAGTAVCPDGVDCPGPWKPTGVLSGGLNGHAFISSAAQHALTEFHRDGTPIRAAKLPMDDDPRWGTVPRLLGTQFMPNGNIIQAVCDANFFNAVNSDPDPDAKDGNSSNNYFPPVYSTPERAQNSRLLVLDQETLEVIDEYSAPDDPRWTCMAGIAFSDEGMFVSMFHGDAVFVIDWKAGVDNEKSEGVGSNSPNGFKLGKQKNIARVIRVIDMLGDENGPGDPWDPNRRDSLRAISFDEGGNLYATNRARSEACEEGEACNPGVFRQRISIVRLGDDYPSATLALDPGVNVIAGLRTNRMSGPGCDAINPPDAITGIRPDPDACDVETLLVAASAMNPGCVDTGPIGANPCFRPGGYVAEYLIDSAHLDADDGSCSGDPFGNNAGCALPIATFFGSDNDEDNVDPRMLMVIHEAFVQ